MQRSLFDLKLPPDSAVLVERGLCTIEMHGTVPFAVPVEGTLVGAEEIMLAASRIECGERLYQAYLEQGEPRRSCARDEVLNLLHQFEFGFTQNRFSSQLLQRATQSLVEDKQSLSVPERAHEGRARAYAGSLVSLKSFAEAKKHAGLLPLVAHAAAHPFFDFGVKLRREQFLSSLKLSASNMPKRAERVPARTVLCQDGDVARGMYVLLEGKIAVLQANRIVARVQETGEAFGEMALFLEGKRTATLVAEADCAVFIIREEDMPEFHRSHPDVFFNVGATLAQRIQYTLKGTRSLAERKESLALYSPAQLAEGIAEVKELSSRLEAPRGVPRNVEFETILDDHRTAALA